MGPYVGPKGDKGDQGEQGEKGEKGDNASAINILGTLDSEDDLPAEGQAGDGYVIEGNLWAWVQGAWVDIGPFQGPAGKDALTLRVLGTVNAVGDLPVGAVAGDAYLV